MTDAVDLCPKGEVDWIRSSITDADGDGCHDVVEDLDDDNDGTSDLEDVFPLNPSEWNDSDGDGTGDNGDAFPDDPAEQFDADGDGWGDNSDLFPYDTTEWADADRDGTGDNADADDDNDGFLDEQDLSLIHI